MQSAMCGWCGVVAQMIRELDPVAIFGDAEEPFPDELQAVYKCAHCGRLSLAINDCLDPVEVEAGVDLAWGTWLPAPKPLHDFTDVPEHIASAAQEAGTCLAAGAYRAVGALARAVVEATAKDKEITKGNLAEKINALQRADLIRPLVAEQAHEVRHFGNGMAHGDFADPVSRAEAEEILGLMVEVLQEVYEAPAKFERLKERRLAKKAQK